MLMTPQQSYPKLAQTLGIPEIILKREDLHPYGSHKGRSIPYMMEEYIKKGYSNFVISSSGNAALAALKFVQDCNKTNTKITLKIFIGKNIAKNKLSSIQSEILNLKSEILVEQVDNPKQSAFLEAKNNNKVINLRQSTDDLALEGYKTLADELEEIDNLEAIFIPTSSGTTAQALGNLGAQIHVVQTTACHPIAEFFSPYQVREHLSRFHIGSEIERGSKPHPNPPLQGEGKSIAGAIVDKIAHRKEKIIEIIKNSHGSGWIVTDEEIQNAIKLVKETINIDISPNSALSIAGLQKATQNGWTWSGPVACLITGK